MKMLFAAWVWSIDTKENHERMLGVVAAKSVATQVCEKSVRLMRIQSVGIFVPTRGTVLGVRPRD